MADANSFYRQPKPKQCLPTSMDPDREFHEVIDAEGHAPFRWHFHTDEKITITFGVYAACNPVSGIIRFGEGREQATWDAVEQNEPLDSKASGTCPKSHKLFQIALPMHQLPKSFNYQVGYRTKDGAQHWKEGIRFLLRSNTPQRSTEIEDVIVGRCDGAEIRGPKPRVAISPAPKDWRHRLFYSVLIDRFAQGTPQTSIVHQDKTDPFSAHGGTISGLQEKLDYLADLGVGAIVLSPVYVNDRTGYHGYHPLNLYAVDPQFGDIDALRSLVSAAHERNIAIILDVIVNHMAPSILWSQGSDRTTGDFRYFKGEAATPLFVPEDFRQADKFHAPGQETLVGAPLFGFLDDWQTERVDVRAMLIQHMKYWISETNIDGFRLDAVRHVDLTFWKTCVLEITNYAEAIGKHNFFLLGEHASEAASEVGVYSKAALFTGMIDYPLYYRIRSTLVRREHPIDTLKQHFRSEIWHYRDSRFNVAFIDNQDTSRFLHAWGRRFGNLENSRRALHTALAFLILGPEIPCIYYGTEQEFSGELGFYQADDGRELPHDVYVREDMFENPDCTWKFGPLNSKLHPPFDTTNPTFEIIRTLAGLRRTSPALNAGDRYAILDDDSGVFAYFMHCPETSDTVLVAVNFEPDGATLERQISEKELKRVLPSNLWRKAKQANTVCGNSGASCSVEDGSIVLSLAPLSFIAAKLL